MPNLYSMPSQTAKQKSRIISILKKRNRGTLNLSEATLQANVQVRNKTQMLQVLL